MRHRRYTVALALAVVTAAVLTAAAARAQGVTVPRLTAVDRATYEALKVQAEHDPAAQVPDRILDAEAPQPAIPHVVTSFLGLNRPGAANSGFVFVPPDPIVGKSFTRVLEAANSAVRLHTTTGAVLDTKSLNVFFGVAPAGSSGLLFDPKVYFDRLGVNRRFYVVALEMREAPRVSRIHVGVSRSADPSNLGPAGWCRYAIDGRRNAGTARDSWADYEGLGVGVDKLVITANQFTFSSGSFTYAIIRVLNKLVLANNAAGCPALPFVFTFQPSAAAGNGAVFTLQPVQHALAPASAPGVSNPVYLVNTIFGTSNVYRVWRVRNFPPSLQGPVNVQGNLYGNPPNARQKGSALLLDTGDTRVTQASAAQTIGIVGVHSTLCNVGGGPTESCVRAVLIKVGSGGGGSLIASMFDQFTLGLAPGDFLFWPGVADTRRDVGIGFHKSSPTSFLSSFVSVGSTLIPLTVGNCPQTTNRTGDYFGVQPDPVDLQSIWFAGERATVVGGRCQWEMRIIKVVQ
ncbi:MAG TPA: hypothetical protein VGX21_23260 [Methylomirabilota bacterium]|jgi:hypothetical protein|nr:hypothetical protein [Methylomirabilota bacterium]